MMNESSVVREEIAGIGLVLFIFVELSTVYNFNGVDGFVTFSLRSFFGGFTDVPASDDSSKDSVLLVKVRGGTVADKELRAIGIGSSVSHGEDSRVSVGEPDAFISELLSVNAFASSSVSHGGVSTLHHEAVDDSVEGIALVRGDSFLFSSAQSAEVLSSDRDLVIEELENDTTLLRNSRSFGLDLNIKVDLRVALVEVRELANNFAS